MISKLEKMNMKFKMVHENYNVADLEKSLRFYEEALGLTEKRRKTAADGSFIIVYVGNDESDFELELTWLRDHPQPYALGEWEFILSRIRTATGWRLCRQNRICGLTACPDMIGIVSYSPIYVKF